MPWIEIGPNRLRWIPEGRVENTRSDAPQVISDTLSDGLEHMAYSDGRRTDSKSTYRKWTKEAGCVEKGNDRESRKPQIDTSFSSDVAQSINMLKQGHKPRIRQGGE